MIHLKLFKNKSDFGPGKRWGLLLLPWVLVCIVMSHGGPDSTEAAVIGVAGRRGPSGENAVRAENETSAVRLPGEHFEEFEERVTRPDFKRLRNRAIDRKLPLDRVRFDSLPELPNQAVLQEVFERIRDDRFLVGPQIDKKPFLRRISWLYAYEGCFSRAAAAAWYLEQRGYVRPGKVFAFGDLRLETRFSNTGPILWGFHVAAAYRVEGKVYVLDPSISPYMPLTVTEWIRFFDDRSRPVTVSVCSTYTYTFDSPCETTDAIADQWGIDGQTGVNLGAEQNQLKKLNLNPLFELGERPYWLR